MRSQKKNLSLKSRNFKKSLKKKMSISNLMKNSLIIRRKRKVEYKKEKLFKSNCYHETQSQLANID